MPAAEVVIVDDAGTEHHFPAGFDPQQAVSIVLRQTSRPDFTSENAKDAAGNATVASRVPGFATIGDMVGDVGIGVAKGIGRSVSGLGELVHRLPGVSTAVDALYGQPGLSQAAFRDAKVQTEPTNTAQRVGFTGEQLGEFFLPVGAVGKVRTAAEIGKSALLTGAQGGTGADAAVSAGLSAVIPGAGAVKSVGRKLEHMAPSLVRAAIKPTVSAMKQVAGASVSGIDAQAKRLVNFILEHKLTTAEKARTMIQQTEQELQRVLSLKNAPTDAPQRAVRYLAALERQAAKQGLPAQDVAIIRNAAAEVLETGLGHDVVTMVPKPHPTLVGPNGQPLTVMTPKTSRALRTDVMADDALERARANSKWDSKKSWGEQKGAQMEASKAVERAERDAVKAAVPEAKPILKKYGMAIDTAKMLDRAEFRAANRDAVSLPAHVMAAGEIASGRVPVLAFAANWLRNNQLKAGVWSNQLAHAIQQGNAEKAAAILKRLGVGMASESMRTATP